MRCRTIPDSFLRLILLVLFTGVFASTEALALELAGLSVTPHAQSPNMRYRRPPDPQLGARIELFLRNETAVPVNLGPETPLSFDQRTPSELLLHGDWAWHDTPPARKDTPLVLAPDALTVWSLNSRGTNWGVDTTHRLQIGGGTEAKTMEFAIERPRAWLSAVTFLGSGESPLPTQMVVHVQNETGQPLFLAGCRLWLPRRPTDFRDLIAQTWQTNLSFFPATAVIPDGEKGGFLLDSAPLPLGYAGVEVRVVGADGGTRSLWAYLRIKREVFDLGGGWVASALGSSNTLTAEPYLKLLRRLHINLGMHQDVPGYTDTPLFDRYPLKYMNRLAPFDHYDTDAMLPRIHAVEFLGEPQYGGGRPVPPQEVFEKLAPYAPTRLPTTVTHSEERVWRYYAGLADYPHFDAYRVTAPAPDAWGLYDRWGGERLRWGAPLETIGDMTRSLRDLNRPRPIAVWSQGPHDGWDRQGGRVRTSPTADELRSQAYHALSSRITSLYWFNLSLGSLIKFRDLIDPVTRVDREIRLLEDLFLEGDAFEYRREREGGSPSWDLASIIGPNGGVFFAIDLAYIPDRQEKIFTFSERNGSVDFQLPASLSHPVEVFRLDADGVHDVTNQWHPGRLKISDRIHVVGIYVVSPKIGLRSRLEARHKQLLELEKAIDFDPAASDADFETLRHLRP